MPGSSSSSSTSYLCDFVGLLSDFLLLCTSSSAAAVLPILTSVVVFILSMAFLSTKVPPPHSILSLQRRLCLFCPPSAERDDDETGIDNSILFLPKEVQQLPNLSFETALITGGSSLEEEEEEEILVTRNIKSDSGCCFRNKSVKSSDSTIRRRGPSSAAAPIKASAAATTTATRVKVNMAMAMMVPSIEETSHDDPTEEKNRRDSCTAESDEEEDKEGWFSIQCHSKYECDEDNRSDASDLTMPSFRPNNSKDQQHKNNNSNRRRILPKSSKMLQKVQKAVLTRVQQTLRSKQRKDGHNYKNKEQNASDDNASKDVLSCSCLILLMEPNTYTFEILPLSYLPGVSSVSDLLEQIPLQSSFNFRLRYQNYTGLMAFEESSNVLSKAMQLPQSQPVPMRYSCEFHHYETTTMTMTQAKEQVATTSAGMMPLVAILPESSGSNSTAAERSELLARKLLSVPTVQKRLDFLHELIVSSSSKDANDEDDDDEGDDSRST